MVNNQTQKKQTQKTITIVKKVLHGNIKWPYYSPFPFPFPFFEPGVGNQEVYFSEQSVNECALSLLLKIDSHHQQ